MINKKYDWEHSKKEYGFGKTKIDNFLDEETVYKLSFWRNLSWPQLTPVS